MLNTPIIKSTNIDNINGTFQIDFYYSGNQATKNQLIITRNDTNVEIYNKIIDSYQLKHTVLLNLLVPNIQYKAKIKVFDVSNNTSNFSDETLFSYFASPVLSITNIINNQISNQNFTFQGSYVQPSDKLLSYRFFLYNSNDILIGDSKDKYDELLKHEFTSFNNNNEYKIKFRTISEHGIEFESPIIKFHCIFAQPKVNAKLTLSNDKANASIKISAEIKQILGQVISGTIEYLNGDYVNLKNSKISFNEGFNIKSKEFTMQIFLKDIIENKVFLKLYDEEVIIELIYYNKRIHLFQSAINKQNEYNYHIVSDVIEVTPTDNIYIYINHDYKGFILKASKII